VETNDAYGTPIMVAGIAFANNEQFNANSFVKVVRLILQKLK
jgi:hypothetical protein